MNLVKKVFWNAEEGRPRAATRILAILAVTAGMIMTAQMIINFAFGGLPQDPTYKTLARTFIVALAGTGGLYIGHIVVDKTKFLALGLAFNQTALKDFAFGLLVSLLMIFIFFALQLSFGLIEFSRITLGTEDGISPIDLIVTFLAIGLFVGWFEELLYRGILYQNMEEGLGLKFAIALSCLLYWLIYILSNSDTTWPGGLVIVALGGMRILGFLRTRHLWLSMGLHAGWNFAMAAFGYKINAAQPNGAIEHIALEPNYLSGGAYGPEASILVLPIILFAMAAVLWWTEDRQEPSKDAEAAPTMAP